MRICFLVSLIALSTTAYCDSLPPTTPIPGGVVVIPLLPLDDSQPTAVFGSRRIMVAKANHNWLGIVGISRDQIPGEYIVTAYKDKSSIISFHFRVYARRHIDPDEANITRPDAELNEDERNRWEIEKKQLGEIVNIWSTKSPIDLNLKHPVAGSLITNEGNCGFGSKSNLKIDGFRFTASEGTKLRAPTDATVIATGIYTVSGKTIVLDHGQGMISVMCYLKEIVVKQGQQVAKDAHIANLGVTSRTGESRADWILMLNGSWVDPGIFLSE